MPYSPSDSIDSEFDKARDDAILWARAVLADPDKFVIVDTETTGLRSHDEIVQFSAIDMAGNPVCNTLIKPRIAPVTADAEAVHHISQAMLEGAPDFPSVYEAFRHLVEGKTVITYNVMFDQCMIAQSLYAHDVIALPGLSYVCAMLMYAQFFGDWDYRRGCYRWQKLTGGDHSALGDCIATLQLIRRMAAAKLSTEESALAEEQ